MKKKTTISDRPLSEHIQPLLTIADLEKMLRVNKRTIAKLCKIGELPRPLKLGGSNRWRLEDVLTAIDQLDRSGKSKHHVENGIKITGFGNY